MSVNPGFPPDLLTQPAAARLAYFTQLTIAHPLLTEAYEHLRRVVNESSSGSLVFVFGPTGVGKTTMRLRFEQRLIEEMATELAAERGRIPVISVEAVAPDSGNFNWKDFYKRLLLRLDEPLVDQKVSPDRRDETFRRRGHPMTSRGTATTEWRLAVERALHHRQPRAILIDEAQHLTKMASGRRLQDQLDSLKSLASLTRTIHILLGTYELLAFRNLSAQLSRRSLDIHLRRYRADQPEEATAFKNVLLTFQKHLPLAEEPDLAARWDYFYERSVGCVGVLKEWLARSLALALESGSQSLSLHHLERQGLSIAQCEKMLAEASEGENILTGHPEARARLRGRMGLEPVSAQPAPPTMKKPPREVGRRKPKRDQVGLT
jgi:ABC-type nitrate/sulfonate/bicarbonate transport system ATPase subunit